MTGRNPNVFYELGLAHGLAKPVVMLTQSIDEVPSDLRSLKLIQYSTISPRWADVLRQKLTHELKAILVDDQRMTIPFIHPNTRLAETPILKKGFTYISGTQKQILDYLRWCNGPVNQRTVEKRFSNIPPSELYYRLECLRLLGFLKSQDIEEDSAEKGFYAYELSDEVRQLFR